MTREDFDAIMELGGKIREIAALEELAARRQIRNAVLYGFARSFAIGTALWLLFSITGS